MNRGIITISEAIRAIYKNKELNEAETMRYIRQPDGISYDVYLLAELK